jgi:chromosome partitioning protein
VSKKIAVAVPKGGVGKTTTAVNLAAALAIAEKRTLLIDFDPSGACAVSLGFDKDKMKGDIFQVISFIKYIDSVIHKTELKNLDFIPCSINSAEIEERITRLTRNIHLFENILNQFALEEYDYIIIDCPPYLKGLTTVALTAADSVLIPIRAGKFSISALEKIYDHITWVRDNLNAKLKVEGILLTMFEQNTKAWALTQNAIFQRFEKALLNTIIPKSVTISEAEFYGKPTMLFDIKSSGSIAYLQLAKELMNGKNHLPNKEEEQYQKKSHPNGWDF